MSSEPPASPNPRPNDPRKVDDGPARSAIERGEGVTESERYLAKLAEQSFLNLWCYPNVYIDKKVRGKGDGKELCDLLVVFGDHVLIFSDKTVAWPDGDDVKLAWRRWYKRAIQKSVEQIQGAARWIAQHPDRIFVDPACAKALPLPLPLVDRRKIHGIVVANGAAAACRDFFGMGSGSLMLMPSIAGDAHYAGEDVAPFTIGDVDPGGPFVHVLDEATLDVVMRELDTVTDLTAYLAKKEVLIRSGRLLGAAGEEELVAEYLVRMNEHGEHDFTKPDGTAWGVDDHVTYGSGLYAAMIEDPRYIAKKKADSVSYAWDRLITLFTDHMLAGTSLVAEGQSAELSAQELAVRQMAQLSRFERRGYGAGVLDAMAVGQKADKFMRAFLPGKDSRRPDIGFFFVTFKIPEFELRGGYQQYRAARQNLLHFYALSLLRKNPQLKRIVGIATEPKPPPGQTPGSSEDLIYAEPPPWTDEVLAELEEGKKAWGIDQPGSKQRTTNFGDSEYPELPAAPRTGPNRKERRAMKAKQRREERKRR